MSDYLTEGQVVRVKVLETDEKGRVKLSMKALAERTGGGERQDRGDRPERGERRDRPEHAPREAEPQQQGLQPGGAAGHDA